MDKKSKKCPHAFFERGSWYHRTKTLKEDYSVVYGKAGGFQSDEEAEKDYDAAVLTLGENGSTANKWIEAFIKDGKLCRIEQGKYRKTF